MFVRSLFLFFILFFAGFNYSQAQTLNYSLSADSLVNQCASKQKVYQAVRIQEKPRIDGVLNDACWNAGRWDGSFVQQQPFQAHEPSQYTEICILYDDDNLYVGMKCYDDDPSKIRSVLSRRDEFSGDMAGIAIDSYADNRTAFEFSVTAAGQKVDLMHLGAGEFDQNWDAVWDGKASVQDSMWVAELSIPFSQLRFAHADEQIWGMHIWRWIDRLLEEDQWKLIPVDAPAMVYLFGELRGIEDINTKRHLEFLPYTNAKYSPNTELKDKWNYGVGLDGKIGLSSDFTLNYTVNPDFGQVEADPSVLSLSTYEVFYDEKRPFFLEGNNVLDFSMGSDLLFYSRRIGHAPSFSPDWDEETEKLSMPENTSILSALKLTGKNKKGLSLGVVQSFTAKEHATIYRDQGKEKQAVEPFSNYFVGRVKQDFNQGNTVLGGMVSSVLRDIDDEQLNILPTSSFAGGIDLKHNWAKRKYYVDMKGIFSRVNGNEEAIKRLQLASQHYFQRPDADHLEYDASKTSLSGHGGELKGGKRSGRLRAIGSFSWRSPGIDLNDMGYLYQADFLKEDVQLRYQVNQPKGILRDYWFRITQMSAWSYGGEKNKQEIGSHAYLRFKNLWSIHSNLERDFGLYDTRELRGGQTLYKESTWDAELFIQSNPAKDLFLAFGSRLVWGDDHISNRNINTFQFSWQVSENFSISSKTVYSTNTDFHQYAGRGKVEEGARPYIVGQIDQKTLESTLRMEFFLTPEFSLQYYASPYASVGKYSCFRRVADGKNSDLSLRYAQLTGELNDQQYNFSDGDSQYTMSNPDFNFQEFNSNLVARWEFRPGSTLYLVWNNSLSKKESTYEPSVTKSFGDVFGQNSQNVFMLKFSYWFSL